MNKTYGYILLLVLLSVTCVFSVNLYFRERTSHDVVDIRTFPLTVDGWKGKDIEVTEKEYQILETKNLIFREYADTKNNRIGLFIIYSETNRSVFHPPEVCLIGSGVTIVDKKTEEIKYGKRLFSVNKLYTEKDGRKELVLYLYKAGDLYTSNYYLQQAYFAVHQMFGRKIAGATIRVSILVTGSEEKALGEANDFIAKTIVLIESL